MPDSAFPEHRSIELCTIIAQTRPKTIEVTGNTFGINACKVGGKPASPPRPSNPHPRKNPIDFQLTNRPWSLSAR